MLMATDALEFLLAETDLDTTTPIRHAAPVADHVFYGCGATNALSGWSTYRAENLATRRIEGVYVRPTPVDAYGLTAALREQWGLLPSPAECWTLGVVEYIDSPEVTRTIEVTAFVQDMDMPVHELISRTIRNNGAAAATLGESRMKEMLLHMTKFWLYISSQAEFRRFDAVQVPQGYSLPAVTPLRPVLLFGPHALEPLLTPKICHDSAVAIWERGSMSTRGVWLDKFVLSWRKPALIPQPVLQAID